MQLKRTVPVKMPCGAFQFKSRTQNLHHTAKSPNIWFTAMALLVKDFRRQVVWGSAYCSSPVFNRFQLSCQAKVPYLQLHCLINEKVTCQVQKEQLHCIYLKSQYIGYIFGATLSLANALNGSPNLRSLWRISCSWRYFSPEMICLR